MIDKGQVVGIWQDIRVTPPTLYECRRKLHVCKKQNSSRPFYFKPLLPAKTECSVHKTFSSENVISSESGEKYAQSVKSVQNSSKLGDFDVRDIREITFSLDNFFLINLGYILSRSGPKLHKTLTDCTGVVWI